MAATVPPGATASEPPACTAARREGAAHVTGSRLSPPPLRAVPACLAAAPGRHFVRAATAGGLAVLWAG